MPEEPAEIDDINKMLKSFSKGFKAAYKIADKSKRQTALNEVRSGAKAAVGDEYDAVLVDALVKGMEADIVRGAILKTGVRIDGRDTKTVGKSSLRLDSYLEPMGHPCLPVGKHKPWSLLCSEYGPG